MGFCFRSRSACPTAHGSLGEDLPSAPNGSLWVPPRPCPHQTTAFWSCHSRVRTKRRHFGPATAVSAPNDGILVLPQPCPHQTTAFWSCHGRVRTKRQHFGPATAVSAPNDGILVPPQPCPRQTTAFWSRHSRVSTQKPVWKVERWGSDQGDGCRHCLSSGLLKRVNPLPSPA